MSGEQYPRLVPVTAAWSGTTARTIRAVLDEDTLFTIAVTAYGAGSEAIHALQVMDALLR